MQLDESAKNSCNTSAASSIMSVGGVRGRGAAGCRASAGGCSASSASLAAAAGAAPTNKAREDTEQQTSLNGYARTHRIVEQFVCGDDGLTDDYDAED